MLLPHERQGESDEHGPDQPPCGQAHALGEKSRERRTHAKGYPSYGSTHRFRSADSGLDLNNGSTFPGAAKFADDSFRARSVAPSQAAVAERLFLHRSEPAHQDVSTRSQSSADADIEPVTKPLCLEGLLPNKRLGVRLRQPHLRWLGEEMTLQG